MLTLVELKLKHQVEIHNLLFITEALLRAKSGHPAEPNPARHAAPFRKHVYLAVFAGVGGGQVWVLEGRQGVGGWVGG